MYEIPGNSQTFDRRSPRRRKRLTRLIVAVGLAAAAGLASLVISRLYRSALAGNPRIPSEESILAAWNARNYDEVLTLSEEGLSLRPLDPFRLVMSGFASFYRGVGESDGEIRLRYMDASIFSLRKALTSQSVPFRSQVEYVLGKAYYHKGPYYMDEAARHLEAAFLDAEARGEEAPRDRKSVG